MLTTQEGRTPDARLPHLPKPTATTFPASLALPFAGLPEVIVGKNGKRGQCRPGETADDRYDKGPRTPSTPTPRMAAGGEGAVSVLCQATDHIPTGAARRRAETAVPLSRCSRRSRGAALRPEPHDSLGLCQLTVQAEQPAEPGGWLTADRLAIRGLYDPVCKMEPWVT